VTAVQQNAGHCPEMAQHRGDVSADGRTAQWRSGQWRAVAQGAKPELQARRDADSMQSRSRYFLSMALVG